VREGGHVLEQKESARERERARAHARARETYTHTCVCVRIHIHIQHLVLTGWQRVCTEWHSACTEHFVPHEVCAADAQSVHKIAQSGAAWHRVE